MKINEVRLYKTQLDNSYRNVIDFHYIYKTGVNIYDDTMDAGTIKQIRYRYFNSLGYLELTLGSGIKSVKVDGNFITISVSGLWENIRDYNYITLRLKNTALRDIDYTSETYCFISSYTSNNDSDSPSTTIVCEIDYWTNYIDKITLDTPIQYEEYAHEYVGVRNSVIDERIPTEFIMSNIYSKLINDVVLFLKVTVDIAHSPVADGDRSTAFDPSGIATDILYIPYMRYYNGAFTPILGYAEVTNGVVTGLVSWDDYVSKYGYLKNFNDQYTYDATITAFTPIGIVKASDYTVVHNNTVYFKVTTITNEDPHKAYGVINSLVCISKLTNEIGYLYACIRSMLTPINNSEYKIGEIETVFFNNYNDINDPYANSNEAKLLQYPYRKYTLIYKANEFNVTPEPHDTVIEREKCSIYIKRLNELVLRITNGENIGDTRWINMSDNDGLPISVNAWELYKQNSLAGDLVKAAASAGTALAGSIALAPATGGASLAGGFGAVAVSESTILSNVLKAKALPNEIKGSANNSFDNLEYLIPVVKYSFLKTVDKKIITDVWRKHGYPIKQFRAFDMKRFWYDYKKISNPVFSQITNALARKKIESAVKEGVTIWHINYDGTNFKYIDIGDYNINNPSRNACKEEIQ